MYVAGSKVKREFYLSELVSRESLNYYHSFQMGESALPFAMITTTLNDKQLAVTNDAIWICWTINQSVSIDDDANGLLHCSYLYRSYSTHSLNEAR